MEEQSDEQSSVYNSVSSPEATNSTLHDHATPRAPLANDESFFNREDEHTVTGPRELLDTSTTLTYEDLNDREGKLSLDPLPVNQTETQELIAPSSCGKYHHPKRKPTKEVFFEDPLETNSNIFPTVNTIAGQQGEMFRSPKASLNQSASPTKESEYLRDGEQHHVWKPGKNQRFGSQHPVNPLTAKPLTSGAGSKEVGKPKVPLAERKKSLDMRVLAAHEALRQDLTGELSPKLKFRAASRRVSANIRAQKRRELGVRFHNVVEDYVKHVQRQRTLYNSHQKHSRASIKTLSPCSSPKIVRYRRRHRNPSTKSCDGGTKFNSLERRSKHHHGSMPHVSSGLNLASRLHHVSPLTTPTSSPERNRCTASHMCESFQVATKLTKAQCMSPPSQNHPSSTISTSSPSLNTATSSSAANTTAASVASSAAVQSTPLKPSMMSIDTYTVNKATTARLAPLSLSPSKSSRVIKHPLKKSNAAASVTSSDALGGHHGGSRQLPTSGTTKLVLSGKEKNPVRANWKRSFSDSDA